MIDWIDPDSNSDSKFWCFHHSIIIIWFKI